MAGEDWSKSKEMKKLILQHWSGEMDELGTLSSANIAKYATKVGADYKLLRGDVFNPKLCAPMQKLFMLDESFDEYDVVVMLDIDMFTRVGMDEDIFDKGITGVGMCTELQEKFLRSLCKKHPNLTNPKYPYWGGAIYKLDKELRQRLRVHLDEEELLQFAFRGNFQDEGAMHRLAILAQVPKCKLPGSRKWCYGSSETVEGGVENAMMIHIRNGPKFPKLDNYKDLVNRGLIEANKE